MTAPNATDALNAWIKRVSVLKNEYTKRDGLNPDTAHRRSTAITNIQCSMRAAVENVEQTKDWSKQWIRCLVDLYGYDKRIRDLARLQGLEEQRLLEKSNSYPNELNGSKYQEFLPYARISVGRRLTSTRKELTSSATMAFDIQRKELYLNALKAKICELELQKAAAEKKINADLKVKVKNAIGLFNMLRFDARCEEYAALRVVDGSMPYFFIVRPDQEPSSSSTESGNNEV
ncbi:uncharacterized protein LOC129589756 [Paramacrobiotus metropolitanus]|uniref:uncharacterized protein LOC129589756 n=1 Tax=Paramacrobiotus metropolitanus TaxID=2943436 RepID=UPI0024463D7B|nr:uncharacterized protein LOC129589756 [Paramacrobiotus metropolitanus]